MAAISAAAVMELREKTGAGMMDCKKALTEANGSAEQAVELLRERGLAKAVKRGGRETTEGAICIAFSGSAGGMLELGCETDFVAKTDDFQSLAASLCQSVAEHSGIGSPEELLGTEIGGAKVEEQIRSAISKLGENIVVKRVARLEGSLVGGYVHAGGKLGVLVALEGASGDSIEVLAKDVAMHVAAADPSPASVDRDSVAPDVVEKERQFFRRQAEQDGKPAQVIDKIVEGKVNRYFKENVLLEQPFVKDPDRTVKALLADVGKQVGAEVSVTGFRRFKLGEQGES